MVDIQVNDVIVAEDRFYKVLLVHEQSNTMDLKCFNEPLIYKCVPISNLNQAGIQILKEVPQNVKFLFAKTCT